MAIVHVNGFGTIPVSGDYASPLNATAGSSVWSRQTGRYGGYAVRHSNTSINNTSGYVGKLTLPAMDEFAVGIAVNHRATATPQSVSFGFSLIPGGSLSEIQLGTGVSNVYAAATSTSAWTVLDSSTTSVGWHWWCWLFKYHATAGVHQIYRDGVLLAQQGSDTLNSAGGTTAITIRLGNDNGGAQADFGDLIVRNDATLIPDSVVTSLFPDSTTANAWVGSDSDSVNNHLLIDENPTYDPADYVGASSAGALDTYTIGNLPNTASSVHAVQVAARAFKSDAGARTMRTRINSQNGTAADPGGGSTIYQLATTSDGSTAWTTSSVNAMTASVEVVS